jgi:hypothetical protein
MDRASPGPRQRGLIETLLLAGMGGFVVVEISDPRPAPLELQAIASNYGVAAAHHIRKVPAAAWLVTEQTQRLSLSLAVLSLRPTGRPRTVPAR